MSRYFVTLWNEADRIRAINVIAAAPAGARVEVKAAKRSLPQNDRLWALLSDIAMQLPWHGQKLTPDNWKILFLDALKRETHLSKSEMSDLFALIESFGATHGVTFHDKAEAA
jgi:hypothetical protein